jgi:hypothetical protein
MSLVLDILEKVDKRNHSDDELRAIAKVANQPLYNIMGKKADYKAPPSSKKMTRADVQRYLQLVT